MNKALIALLLIFIVSALVPVQAGEGSNDKYICYSNGLSGGVYYCSHHPINYDVIERLVCVDERCEAKKDSKTGDKFI